MRQVSHVKYNEQHISVLFTCILVYLFTKNVRFPNKKHCKVSKEYPKSWHYYQQNGIF